MLVADVRKAGKGASPEGVAFDGTTQGVCSQNFCLPCNATNGSRKVKWGLQLEIKNTHSSVVQCSTTDIYPVLLL